MEREEAMGSLKKEESMDADRRGCVIRLVKGDITKQEVDALVNAANTSLSGGGGVDGAIHRAGGPAIMEACDQIRNERGGIATGEAVATSAGKLPAAYIIHTAGPVWHGGNNGEERLLDKCYRSCLKLADQLGLQSLAFPNISTGIYGFPKLQAAEIAINSVVSYLRQHPVSLREVCFVCFDEDNYQQYRQLIPDEQLILPESA